MTPPSIPDYTFRAPIGEGSTGRVFAAEYAGQTLMALKAFDSDSVNRQLISDALVKLFNREEHPGVVAIHDFDLASTQAYMATSLHGEPYQDSDGREAFRPRTIQGLIGHLMPEDSWGYARQIADALAFLHRQRVIHCNLKPSNVLLDSSTPPHIKLTDFSQGLVGSVPKLIPGDSVFYAPPEQIRQPEHYFGGRAERWDVYAFGVLAFQLLTGRYPRLRKAIAQIKEHEAASLDVHFSYDYKVLADMIEDQAAYEWPEPAAGDDESARRAIIDRCLEVKPEDRFPDMREVVLAFRALDDEKERQEEHRKIAAAQLAADKQAGGLKKICAALGLLALAGLGGAAYFSQKEGKLPDPVPHSGPETPGDDPPTPTTTVSEQELEEMQTLLENSTEHLRESQSALDEIVSLVISRDPEGNANYSLPADASGLLLNHYESFSRQHEANPALAREVASAENNAGELHLALGDTENAIKHFEAAVAKMEILRTRDPEDGQLDIATATYTYNLSQAQALAGRSKAAADTAMESHRIWDAMYQKYPTSDGAIRALSGSLIYLGERMLDIGRPADTGLHVQRAKTILEGLKADGKVAEDDLVALSRCDYLLALSERAKGNTSDAIESFISAVDQLLNIKIASPEPPRSQRFALATYYGELADTLALGGNRTESNTANEEAISLLVELVDETNSNIPGYTFELSRRYTTRAANLRDAGKGSEARSTQEKAVSILRDILKVYPKRYDIRLELALQLGDLMDLYSDVGDKEKTKSSGLEAVQVANNLLKEDVDESDGGAKRAAYRLAYGDLLIRLAQRTEKYFSNKDGTIDALKKGIRQLNLAIEAGVAGDEDKQIVKTAEARVKALGGTLEE